LPLALQREGGGRTLTALADSPRQRGASRASPVGPTFVMPLYALPTGPTGSVLLRIVQGYPRRKRLNVGPVTIWWKNLRSVVDIAQGGGLYSGTHGAPLLGGKARLWSSSLTTVSFHRFWLMGIASQDLWRVRRQGCNPGLFDKWIGRKRNVDGGVLAGCSACGGSSAQAGGRLRWRAAGRDFGGTRFRSTP